jgi:hypothetical protein
LNLARKRIAEYLFPMSEIQNLGPRSRRESGLVGNDQVKGSGLGDRKQVASIFDFFVGK